ncbi:hypothetical protein J2W69_004137 [Rheinheimera soli]|uniref:Uncharacterized protein n=1 Tax=Rheinheimera soli TaxID=443616 RepID=A0ABU1W5C0_9GAMM|nr:hypothetical protein [Rheinheimera soli]
MALRKSLNIVLHSVTIPRRLPKTWHRLAKVTIYVVLMCVKELDKEKLLAEVEQMLAGCAGHNPVFNEDEILYPIESTPRCGMGLARPAMYSGNAVPEYDISF